MADFNYPPGVTPIAPEPARFDESGILTIPISTGPWKPPTLIEKINATKNGWLIIGVIGVGLLTIMLRSGKRN
jgi:hypothetical protein